MFGLIFLLVLLTYSYAQMTFVNSTNASIIANMSKVCASAPVTNLNICNTTCNQCLTSNSYLCLSCDEQFFLSSTACKLDTSIHNYTSEKYFDKLDVNFMISDQASFTYSDGSALSASNVVEVCMANTYQYLMAGLFKSTDSITTHFFVTNSIDRIRIKFNFISIVQDMTVNVLVNGNVIFKQKFTTFSDLSGMYGTNGTLSPSYLTLYALSTSNVNSVITLVDTGQYSIIASDVTVTIQVVSSSSIEYMWGFNNFIYTYRACQTCVSKALQNSIQNIVQYTWIVLIITVAFLIALYFMIKWHDIRKQNDFTNKLGAAHGNLPIKAINRVIDTLQANNKTMKDDWKLNNKKEVQKKMKKLTSPLQEKLN